MNQTNRRFSIWYIFGPIIINWLINIAVQFAVTLGYMVLHMERIIKASQNSAETMALILELSEGLMQYTTEVTTVSALILLPVVIFMFRRDQQQKTAETAEVPKAGVGNYFFILILGIALCIGMNNLVVLSNVGILSYTYQTAAQSLYQASLGVQLIGLGIIIPVAEEILYRGLVYGRLKTIFTPKRSLVLSALIFGLAHGNIVQVIYAGVIGLILAYLYDLYGSIKAPIFTHIIMNVVSVLATKLDVFDWIFYSPTRVVLVTGLCAAVGSTMYVLMQRKILRKC